jgi:hypothetical protein
MTLGGLALAVGILVDDATVEIENIERNLAMGKEMKQAILDGAQQIAVPAFVSTLSICIVFVPMFFLTGVAKFLFVPLAEAVSFAMLASYLLSRTLIPTLVMYIMRGHEHRAEAPKSFLGRFQRGFERKFEDFRRGYEQLAGNHPRTSRHVRDLLPGFLPALARAVHVSGSRTSFRKWMPACCACMCGPAPACAWKKRRACATRLKPCCARRFPRANCRRFSTTSVCPTPASTSPTVRTEPSAPAMPKS